MVPPGFSGFTGPEETDTTRGPFRQPAKGVVNDSLSLCVSESQQSAGRFGHNKAVYLSFSFPAGQGTYPFIVTSLMGTFLRNAGGWRPIHET